jgi:hypothetical protein
MKLKFWPLITLVAMMAWACSDDDANVTPDPEPETPEVPEGPETPEEPQEKKLVFGLTGEVLLQESSFWVVISDKQGKVLETAQLQNNTSHTFEAPADFAEETVTLTLINNYDGLSKLTVLKTYAQIPFGSYGLERPETPLTVEHLASLTLEDYGDWYQTSTVAIGKIHNGFNFESTGNDATIDASLSAEEATVLVVKTDNPFYYFKTKLYEGDKQSVPRSAFQQAGAHDIQIPDMAWIFYSIAGINDEGWFGYYNTSDVSPQANYKTVPVIPDLFTSYEVALSGTAGGRLWDYYDYHGGAFPAAMKQVEGTVTYSVGEDNKVSWQTTGEFDVVSITASSNGGVQAVTWDVHGPTGDNQSVVVPEIPTSIPLVSTTAARSFRALSNNYKPETMMTEYTGLSGYVDVWVKPELVPGFTLPWTEKLRRQQQR